MSVSELFELKGRVAAVTGGARGIGRQLALGLAEMGADVALIDLLEPEMDAVCGEIAGLGRRAISIKADVSQAQQVNEAAAVAHREFGKVDILVNCAGITHWAPAEEMSEAAWDKVIDINLKGTFLCCQAFGKEMIKRRYGKIINIASMSAIIVNRPQPQAAYNASKAAVVMLTKSLACEWSKYNINVNCISPGYIRTEMTLSVPEHHPLWISLTPMGRMGEPDELKALVVYLASDASRYMSGHNIVIDGGYTLW